MSNSQTSKIDSFDAKILEIIQSSNKITSDQIAEQVCLSPAAVQRRIKKMREQNIIEAEIAVVNAKAVDRNVTAIVQVSMEREQLHLLDEFKKTVKNHPAVQQCYYVTGSSDFILVVTARDMEDYETFTREIFFDNSNVRSFQTSVVMDNIKVGLSIPVIVEED